MTVPYWLGSGSLYTGLGLREGGRERRRRPIGAPVAQNAQASLGIRFDF